MSVNILKAAALAHTRGAKVLGLAGRTGGKLKELCDVTICIPADSTPTIQEGHLAVLHILCRLVEEALFARQPKAGG
jgi:D-sedoheptulose 7-phosphate isomerase